MADIKTSSEQLVKVYNGLTPKRRLIVLATILLTLASLLALIYWTNRTEFKTIYTGLSPEDAGAVVNSLKTRKIPFKVGADGSTILVPSHKVYELRMEMAAEGLPQSGGIGYEIFDRQSLGVTEFIQKVNFQRAMQGEIARTINQFAEVKNSRVHLTIPKESLFLEEQEKSSASVVLTLYPGRMLRQNQIQGITHLVASSVEGMSPDDVIIVDNHGNLLAGGKEQVEYVGLTASQQQIQTATESNLQRKIESLLGNVVGPGKVIAKVSVDMDFTQIEQTEESYDPEASAVRSEQRSQEKSTDRKTGDSGVPGVMSNTPDIEQKAGGEAAKTSEYNKSDETVNYEISRVTKRTVNQIGTLKRLTAAVLVDGTYVSEDAGEENETRSYKPRSDEEMKKYEALVKQAVGYDEEREDSIEVVNVQFHEMAEVEEAVVSRVVRGINWQTVITYIITAVLFALFFVFGLRPLLRVLSKALEEGAGRAALEIGESKRRVGEEGAVEELPAGVMEQGMQIGERQARIIEFAKKNPRLFAQYLKAWLQ